MSRVPLQFPQNDDYDKIRAVSMWHLTMGDYELMCACRRDAANPGLRFDQFTPRQRKTLSRLEKSLYIDYNVQTRRYELNSHGVYVVESVPEYMVEFRKNSENVRKWRRLHYFGGMIPPVLPFPMSWSDLQRVMYFKVNPTQYALLQCCKSGLRRDQFTPKSNERRILNWLKRDDYVELNRDTGNFELPKWGEVAIEADPMVVATRSGVDERCRI